MRTEKADPAWLHTSRLFRETMYRITLDFAEWCLRVPEFKSARKQQELVERLMEMIRDPYPDESLCLTAKYPMLLYKPGFASGLTLPLEQWRRMEAASRFWPAPIRRAARYLGVGSGELPTWKKISRFYREVGFKAVPVVGYVGAPMQSWLISNRIVPVCTNWVVRYRNAPYYSIPVDTLHDLGHGLGLAMDDYRELLVALSAAAIKTGRYLLSKEHNVYYGRMFEYSFVLAKDGSIEPIGAGPMTMETLRLERGKLRSIVRDPKAARAQRYEFQPFESREEWRAEARNYIASMPKRAKGRFKINVKYPS